MANDCEIIKEAHFAEKCEGDTKDDVWNTNRRYSKKQRDINK